MLPGALPFTSSAPQQPALLQLITSRQAGTFQVRQSLPGNAHRVPYAGTAPGPRMQTQGPGVEPCVGMESSQPSWDLL